MKTNQPKANRVETLHNQDCRMAFGRKDPTCPRCVELINGSAPRAGWQKDYYTNKKIQDARHIQDIKNHDCAKAGCGPVCTFGDW